MEFPAQCRAALALAATPPLSRLALHHVVVAGMGGSATGGDLLQSLAADHLRVPVTVWRDYGIPAFVDVHTLVLATSYSGNTEETRSALDASCKRGAHAAVLTSGGELEALARARGLSMVKLPSGLMPRMALGYLFFPLLGLLEAAGSAVVSAAERAEALEVLEGMSGELGPESACANNEAKKVALALQGRVPVFYGAAATAAVTYRWKTAVEENAKLLAFHGRLPEVNHNEVEGWGDPLTAAFHAVLLRHPEEGEVLGRRMRLTRELIGADTGRFTEVWPRGERRLARLLSLVYLGDWVSYYLALLRQKDPWPVPTLEAVKRRLKEPEPMISLERR